MSPFHVGITGRLTLDALRLGGMCLLALLAARQGKPYHKEIKLDDMMVCIESNGHCSVTIREIFPSHEHD
jgi:hypothetical protein